MYPMVFILGYQDTNSDIVIVMCSRIAISMSTARYMDMNKKHLFLERGEAPPSDRPASKQNKIHVNHLIDVGFVPLFS